MIDVKTLAHTYGLTTDVAKAIIEDVTAALQPVETPSLTPPVDDRQGEVLVRRARVIAAGVAEREGRPHDANRIRDGLSDDLDLVQGALAALTQPAPSDAMREALEMFERVGTKATQMGFGMPGERSWQIEEDSRQSALRWLSTPDNWLPQVRATLAGDPS